MADEEDWTKISNTLEADITVGEEKEAVARIGGVEYYSLQDAVDAVGDGQTITLLRDAIGDGVKVDSGKNFTLDLDGKTYTVDGTLVGSPGTETNGFQLLKNSNITIINGTITTDKAKILIQNYSNLTLENVNLVLDTPKEEGNTWYALSNNNGVVNITGNTSITVEDGNIAFDVCVTDYYPGGAQVTVNTTGTITGDVEYGLWGEKPRENKATLHIKSGTFDGDLIIDEQLVDDAKTNITIEGGKFKFKEDPTEYLVFGKVAAYEDPYYNVVNLTDKAMVLSWNQANPGTIDENKLTIQTQKDVKNTVIVDAKINDEFSGGQIAKIKNVLFIMKIEDKEGSVVDNEKLEVVAGDGQALGFNKDGGFWYWGPINEGFTFTGDASTEFTYTFNADGEYKVEIFAVQLNAVTE